MLAPLILSSESQEEEGEKQAPAPARVSPIDLSASSFASGGRKKTKKASNKVSSAERLNRR
jgi:hypothetical protein